MTEGETANFSIGVTGTGLSYQWRKDGTNIPGATSASLSLAAVEMQDAGLYSVLVSNELGAVISSNASLAVIRFGTSLVRSDGQPVAGSITRAAFTTVSLETAFPDGYIFYTLDGSAPTFSSALYSGAFTISNTVIVRALALSLDFSRTAEAPPVAIYVLLYSVTATSGGAGVASVSPTQPFYASNVVVTLLATPEPGWSFLRWEGDVMGTTNPMELILNRNVRAHAVFGTTLLTNVVGDGTIVITPGGAVPYGETVQLWAVPGTGQKFVAWGNAVSGTSNPRLFTVTQASPTVAALFAATPAGAPLITSHPSNRVISAGGNFTISVAASPSESLQYQWRFDGVAIPDATNHTFAVSNAALSQAGAYDVVVSSPNGTVISQRASVMVTLFDIRPVISLQGPAGTRFQVDYADDLDAGWGLLTNGVLSRDRYDLIDFSNTNRARRFYRTVIE